DYEIGTPAKYDDPALLKEMLPVAERVLGGKSALVEELPEMGGEDFAYFDKVAPAVMLELGVVPANLDKTAVHSPTFLADEAAIPIGVELMADIIMDYQTRHARSR
ncbi:MAG TPA: M20/M25/M40 family metallo-hydrolase, partial [Burkholderiales bacterium]|nr:M20/M25/M40 family metallo-hydrolase [Burkholderiales bacterium]